MTFWYTPKYDVCTAPGSRSRFSPSPYSLFSVDRRFLEPHGRSCCVQVVSDFSPLEEPEDRVLLSLAVGWGRRYSCDVHGWEIDPWLFAEMLRGIPCPVACFCPWI